MWMSILCKAVTETLESGSGNEVYPNLYLDVCNLEKKEGVHVLHSLILLV